MVKRIVFRVSGLYEAVTLLAREFGQEKHVSYRPRAAVVWITVDEDDQKHRKLLDHLKNESFDVESHFELIASPAELALEPLLQNMGAYIDDCDERVDPLVLTGRDACPVCGKGEVELSEPIRGDWHKFKKRHLIRIPPAWVIGSAVLTNIAREQSWTGFEIKPVIDRRTDEPSESHFQLAITAVLPPMHATAPIERSCIPKYCPACRKLGYQLNSEQNYYSRSILNVAQDINFTSEWLAPHFVSCPDLICSNRVVQVLTKLERKQSWLPLKWFD